MNHVTSSYAVTGTGMRRTLGNSVTQWTHPEIGLETLRGASTVETFATQDRSSLNMIMASQTAESHHVGNSLAIAEISTLTLIDRGVRVRRAPLRSVSGRRTAGWMIGKTQEDAIFKITGETQTITKLGGTLHHRIDQTLWDTVIEMFPWTTGAGAVLVQGEGCSIAVGVEGLDHTEINHASSSPPKDTRSLLVKSKDRGTDPSGKMVTRIPSKGNLTGQKKTGLSSGNLAGLEVWTGTYRGRTWTLKCPVRGSEDGASRNPTTQPL